MTRALIYNRVSHDAQGRGYSVSEQETENRAECAERSWEIVDVLTEDPVGASRFSRGERPKWQEVTEVIRAGDCDVLVLWESSRSTRDMREYLDLVDLCERNKVLLCYNGKVFDLSDPDDRHRAGSDALDSERESGKIRRRVLRSVRRRKTAGAPMGKVAYGYRIEYDPETGKPLRRVPDEATAPIVRELAHRLLSGEALYAIAQDLNQRGVRPPRATGDGAKWQETQIKRIALSPTIAGFVSTNGQIDPSAGIDGNGYGSWEAIISEADHLMLVSRLTDGKRKSWKDGSVKHLLVNIAICGVCGAPCKRIKNRNTPSYTCSDKWHVARSQAKVDQVVETVLVGTPPDTPPEQAVVGRLAQPDAIDLLAEGRDNEHNAVSAAREEARLLRARRDALETAAVEGAISAAAFARMEVKLLPQLADVERRAAGNTDIPQVVQEVAGPDAWRKWQSLTVPQRRQLVRALLVPVIHPAGKGHRTFDPTTVELRWKN